jgi:hypothetical protein
MKYKAIDIVNWSCSKQSDNRWIPARPLPYYGWWGVKTRIKCAWFVLIGKYDALDWEDQ